MEIYLARQPIYDRNRILFGYELLYRHNATNSFGNIDGDEATKQLISNITGIELRNITHGKKALINFTENTLKQEIPYLLSPDDIIIEILEDVNFTDELVEACRKYKEKGYVLAVDDFADDRDLTKILPYIDIVKVDFSLVKPLVQKNICKELKKTGVKLLAEKIETEQQFIWAKECGYDYFQGYYFSLPKIITDKIIPISRINYLNILSELSNPMIDMKNIENIITSDVALVYKLLRYINSATFGIQNPINSVMHALVLLGIDEVRKWLLLVSLSNICTEENDEIMNQAMFRGKFCEEICNLINPSKKSSAFIVGLFSFLEHILSKSMEDIISDLSLEKEIKEALLGCNNILRDILSLVLSYENDEQEKLDKIIMDLNLKKQTIVELYVKCLQWQYSFNNMK